MKRIVYGIVLATALAGNALAGGIAFDLPRIDFGTASGDVVTQGCNPFVQPCAD
ncbi:hypothetical protein [Pseudothioclava arenosa]|uniref:hypothetical protein n=1 Tax=Pseudothioclava arenosa TaxID=1795308 RepID=UPI0015C8908F|nr:hypothetical protein [Pseudothioclava arenosa]